MILTENRVEMNTINVAKKKLEMHYAKGVKSELSIFEVANLMDLISNKAAVEQMERRSIFFGFSKN
ncbi:hypothetical protein SAMN05216474_0592 [Lishizhenia tianjinensis]|uniref:Uncharacterized protein n=1 Tax=Lishizhenia tianjinensis TaxID=477690 RepID=A0A1I6Y1W4_9FLAO|nr:hypothetical protein [Lishizhenia tianjinensis]SFT44221.1 hypothetical protein SAMN05216474_0592 [Lishizhenia tianjinensis]